MAIPTITNFKPQLKGDTFRGGIFTIVPAQDLTGASIKCQFRRGGKKNSITLEITDGNGVTINDAVNSIYQIDEITPLDWEVGNYNFDIEITLLNGDIITPNEGVLPVKQDTTHD